MLRNQRKLPVLETVPPESSRNPHLNRCGSADEYEKDYLERLDKLIVDLQILSEDLRNTQLFR